MKRLRTSFEIEPHNPLSPQPQAIERYENDGDRRNQKDGFGGWCSRRVSWAIFGVGKWGEYARKTPENVDFLT